MATDFDERAGTWDDDPTKVERGRVVAEAVRIAVPMDGSTRLLEYGAGTGLAAQALVGVVGPITLADPSAGMQAAMRQKLADGIFPADTRIWGLDLAGDPAPAERFDLILTVMALHHVVDIAPVLNGFARLLAEGGSLCVVDLETDEHGSFHAGDPDFDGHHGFDRRDLSERLTDAGFVDVRFEHVLDVDKEDGSYPLFLAVATIGRRGPESTGRGRSS